MTEHLSAIDLEASGLRTASEEAIARLHEEGGVEALVAEGRIPLIGPRLSNGVLVRIPPVGTTLEDSIVHGSGRSMQFIGPNGERRGSATITIISRREAALIDARIDAALATPPPSAQ